MQFQKDQQRDVRGGNTASVEPPRGAGGRGLEERGTAAAALGGPGRRRVHARAMSIGRAKPTPVNVPVEDPKMATLIPTRRPAESNCKRTAGFEFEYKKSGQFKVTRIGAAPWARRCSPG